MAGLLIVLVAVGLAGLSTAFTLYEARLACVDVPGEVAVASMPSSGSSLAPDPASPAATLAGIVSRRARCGCGDALEAHRRGACGGCTCTRFNYAGGLVAQAS